MILNQFHLFPNLTIYFPKIYLNVSLFFVPQIANFQEISHKNYALSLWAKVSPESKAAEGQTQDDINTEYRNV
jgi:hypothetical protein